MALLKRYFKALTKQGWRIIGSYFAWMRKFAKHPEKYPFEFRQKKIQSLASKVVKDMNVEFIIEGKENIPDTTSAIYGNHLSMMDPLSLVCTMDKPTSYLSKKENEKMPFVGKIMLGLQGVFMDRNDLKQSLKCMMHIQKDLEEGNKNWVIFPDGTRNKDPLKCVGEFHHGSFRPAMKAGVPIVPVAFYGTNTAMSTKRIYKKYPVYIKFLKPIMPSDYEGKTTNEVAQIVHDSIQRTVSFDLRPKFHKYMCNYTNYRFNQM